ncbi:hypothetical protein R1sor_007583 [Riccia sorocarpa]|uniref:Transposase n=1 Tax=Riccia sorocarpa TaxID=122646 RepID=A0ABD3HQV9_9MARC
MFLNFRTKHLNSKKHKVNWCRRKNIDAGSVPAKTTSEDIDHRAETKMGVEIVNRINEEEDGERKPFVMEGDVNREPVIPEYTSRFSLAARTRKVTNITLLPYRYYVGVIGVVL